MATRMTFRLSTTIEEDAEMTDYAGPIHPGEILAEDFLKPMGLSGNALAIAIGVPPQRVNEIVKCRRAVTADTALRLGRYFGTTARWWTNMQASYDLRVAEASVADDLARIRPRPAGT